MPRRLPKYTQSFQDRHGRWRSYLRKKGLPRIALHGVPWSDEFMREYVDALNGAPMQTKAPQGAAGTLAAVVDAYYEVGFPLLRKSTQAAYRGILDKIRAAHGQLHVADLTAANFEAGLAKRAKTPHAANRWLKIQRMLMARAVKMKLRPDNPTAGIKFLKVVGDGHAAWTAELVEMFRARHASGTKARLALELLVGTMQRRGDVTKMGRQHMSAGYLCIRQSKTGTLVELPVLSELAAELALLPAGQMTFLMTEQGRPFTDAGFGNWFGDRRNEAGIPAGYSAHGLRKYGAVLRAERGCSTQEIMSWGGWKTLSEVERYTAAVNRRQLAQGTVARLETK